MSIMSISDETLKITLWRRIKSQEMSRNDTFNCVILGQECPKVFCFIGTFLEVFLEIPLEKCLKKTIVLVIFTEKYSFFSPC